MLFAGAAQVDITPAAHLFLFGYVHTERTSTGVHDPLYSSALYLSDERTSLLFIANDVIFIAKDLAARARRRIAAETHVPPENILISATHTHSGPVTVDYVSSRGDPTVPPADPAYLRGLEDGIVRAACLAQANARPAELGLAQADGSALGANRRDPAGPADPCVPVLLARALDDQRPIACMLVVSMHPTVLHEDSTLVSADFPGETRRYLQSGPLQGCPLVYHTGPSGNQSPRHVTRANTFAEVARLGEALGQAVECALAGLAFHPDLVLSAATRTLNLPRKAFLPPEEAEAALRIAIERLERLRLEAAPSPQVRTAEVDWFGAEETVTLARAARDGSLEAAYAACLPAEVQLLRIGDWAFVAWPGEIFVEYALELKTGRHDVFVISLANGELQGYVVTPQAARQGGYEASNGLFAPESGRILVEAAADLLAEDGDFPYQLRGPDRERAVARCHEVIASWGLTMPAGFDPLVLDFGLGRFAEVGEIEYWIANQESAGYCGKFLFVDDGQTCPYHRHELKHETFFVLKGRLRMVVDGAEQILAEGDTLVMPPGQRHSFTGIGPALVLEVSMPSRRVDNFFADPAIGQNGVI
jgi:quercetin dioxygenase-like cupin family protein